VVVARGFDHNACLHRRDGVSIVTPEDLIGTDGAGDLQRFGVHVDGDDPLGPAPSEDGDRQRTDGAAADHQGRLAKPASLTSVVISPQFIPPHLSSILASIQYDEHYDD
jgi:hypothetical protein